MKTNQTNALYTIDLFMVEELEDRLENRWGGCYQEVQTVNDCTGVTKTDRQKIDCP